MPWKSWTSVTAPFVEGRCQIRREQTFSQLRFIFHLTFPPLLVTWHAKGSGELDLPVALVQGVTWPGAVRDKGETVPGARGCRSDDVNFHFFVLERRLSLRELLKNKVLLTRAISLPPWSRTPGLVTALCQEMAPCPPGVQVTHQALGWLHCPTPLCPPALTAESIPAHPKATSLMGTPRGCPRMEQACNRINT